MAKTKVTMLFEQETVSAGNVNASRVGGWSESWYWSGDVGGAINVALAKSGLCQLRAALLPRTGQIIGIRAQLVDPPPVGPAVSRTKVFPGVPGAECDIPQMALLLNCPGAGVANVKHYILRGVPDANVLDGEYTDVNGYSASILRYLQLLGGYNFRGQDEAQPRINILTFDGTTKTVTTAVNHNLAIGDVAIIYSMVSNTSGIKVSGKFTVATVPSSSTFTIEVTGLLPSCTGGKMRKLVYIYPNVDSANCSLERVIVRKVGRPFDQYRGRR